MEDLLCERRALINQLKRTIINHGKTAKAKRTLNYYYTRLEALDVLFDQIFKLNIKINSFRGEEVGDEVSEAYDDAEDEYITFKTLLRDGISDLEQPRAPDVPADPAINAFNPANNVPRNDFRLPTISIPTFNGDYGSWLSFKNSFDHLVANNQTLTNLQRLHYLKSSLSGDACKLIQHYDVAEANYEAAWTKLKQRYDNKAFLVNIHLKSLVHQTSQTKENASLLRGLIDSVTDSLNGLRTLGVPTDNWDPLIIYLIIEKIPTETHSSWQSSRATNNDLPTLTAFIEFLENRFRTLEAIADKPSHHNPFSADSHPKSNPRAQRHHSHMASTNFECVLCKDNHYIRAFPSFLRMNVKDRFKTAQQNHICINCLVPGHTVSQCHNKMNCTVCDWRHHTLLHFPPNPTTNHTNHASSTSPPAEQESTSVALTSTPVSNPILLATARINAFNACGEIVPLRALIDPGSQVSFITSKAAQQLNLKPTSTNAKIFGIGKTFSGTSTKTVSLIFQANLTPDNKFKADFLTIPQITGNLPQTAYDDTRWTHIRNLTLADPLYNRNGPIDVLLSAEIYGHIVLPGIQRGKSSEPVAQNTSIGWILFGGSSAVSTSNSNLSLHTLVDLDARLRTFWESEEVRPNQKVKAPEDIESEAHYQETFSRDTNGRFVVRLPFKSDSPVALGSTRASAIQRLHQIEKKFVKDPQLAIDYRKFMTEYEELGHMKLDSANSQAYYIPHHPVIKSSSTTTKLRVVFDASHKSSSGTSLNDHLKVGPTIQDDLTSLIIRWRKYPIAFSADLEKMYRQIRIHELDQGYQRIVWRQFPTDPIQDFKLLTVTYGTACAQYLAIRSLHQLATDGSQLYPLASQRILEDFYVDDLLSGAYEVTDALLIQQQLRDLSNTAGLNLRKWASNHDAVLQSVPPSDREIKTPLLIDFDSTIKSFGIQWNPHTDQFTFKSSLEASNIATTKRTILSEISKLFDPIGWLSPLIIRSKMLMQQLWLLSLGWDDSLPPSIINKWARIREDLQSVHIFSLPRTMSHSINATVELHGFSDASIQAYAAVVYSRILQIDNTYHVTLLAAKSKVAPIKQVTLPRLELCGAHLLTKLIRKVRSDLKIADVKSFAWCDSTIVLHWLQGHPNRLKTFVANRVSDILEHSDIHQWRHVSSKDNPADCATRGLDVASLKSHSLWWNGPPWLCLPEKQWPLSVPPEPESLPDVKTITLTATVTEDFIDHLIHSYSSATHLVRVFARLRRFISNARDSKNRILGPLTPFELNAALYTLIRSVQLTIFHLDYRTLKDQRALHPRSHLLSLNPFLDDEQMLRVGGRLENSNLSYEKKHPLILPKDHHLTKLLIRQTHLNTLHGGPELVITMLRRRYWIINMRSAVRWEIHKCVKCYRHNATRCAQLMGNLPKPRVQVDRPFTHTGVDCAGPINVRMSKGRGARSYKAYVTLFVYLHLPF